MSIPRLGISFAAAAFAGFVLVSGLDRLAGADTTIPADMNWPYARNAPFNATLTAAADHDWRRAAALMDRTLHSDPVNEAVIGRLGQVRLSAGDMAGADAAFRVSAQRGWRDRVTHLYWLQRSVEAGDFTAAALHADALLHAPLPRSMRDQIQGALMEYGEGRDAIARRLDSGPLWAHDFALDIDGEPGELLAARADVIARTAHGVWSCLDTSGIVDHLIVAGYLNEARAAHDATCAQSATKAPTGNLVNDARFVRYNAQWRASQLDWFAPDSADIVISAASGGTNGHGVDVTSSRGMTEQVLAQRVILNAGTYHLTWRMPGVDAVTAGTLLVGLACEPDLGQANAGSSVAGQSDTYAATFKFDGACPAPTLSFWLRPSSKAVSLDAIALTHATN